MDNKKTLQYITDRLREDDDVHTLRLLFEYEMSTSNVNMIDSAQTLHNFLNSLSTKKMEHFRNIRANYVFFILKALSLDIDGRWHGVDFTKKDQRWQFLVKIYDMLINYAKTDCGAMVGRFTNLDLLGKVDAYLKDLDTYDIQHDIPPDPHRDIKYFLCIEEIYHASYVGYWKSISPKGGYTIQLKGQNVLHRWLIMEYGSKHGLMVPINKGETLETLAAKVLERRELFATGLAYRSDLDAFPIARMRVKEIVTSVTSGGTHISLDFMPILIFTSEDLKSTDVSKLFVYDFVLEALMNGISHGCSHEEVTDFLNRGILSLEELIEQIIQVATRPNAAHDVILHVKRILLTSGISLSTSTIVRGLIRVIPTSHEYSWGNMQRFYDLVDEVSLFGLFFFKCLKHASPTSISFYEMMDLMKEYTSERKARVKHRDNVCPEEFDGMIVLNSLIPRPDLVTYEAFSDFLPSNLMRIMFWSYINRRWHLDAIPDKHITVCGVQPVAPSDSIPEDEVSAYCRRLIIGTGDYDMNIVRSRFFAEKFIKHKVVPILQKIMANTLRKNSMIFQLKWLLLFAVEDVVGLNLFRYRLTLFFYELLPLMTHDSRASFVLMLKYWADINSLLEEHVGGVSFSPSLFEFLFTSTYTTLVGHLMTESRHFNDSVGVILDKATEILKLGHAMCHTNMVYDHASSEITLPISGQGEIGSHITLDNVTFQNILSYLEDSCQEYLMDLRNRFNQRLHIAYVKLLTMVEDLRFLDRYHMTINIQPVNITELENMYVRNFRVFYKAGRLFTDCCAANLKRRCRDLMEPKLIDEQILQKIILLSEDADTGREDDGKVKLFIEEIKEPLMKLGNTHEAAKTGLGAMNNEQAILLRELVNRKGASNNAPSQRELFQYTDRVNVEAMNINWKAYNRSEYQSIKRDLTYILVNVRDVLDGTHGGGACESRVGGTIQSGP
ncbi:tegument protein [Vombatid gammaherpesvirus 1]|uniref:Tegument protein n=1 Tax=Vombatid gammaherpesvirus 1 TaxID=2052651 RepID=A0A3Q8J4D4_9GAMA|nr:tegument protein [Vombatid gammaherpesvirus 1]AZB49162.1 tegument protein [Vombatid gammaherpesvirus 1]